MTRVLVYTGYTVCLSIRLSVLQSGTLIVGGAYNLAAVLLAASGVMALVVATGPTDLAGAEGVP